MTIQEIVDRVNSRLNPTTGQAGLLLRLDVDDALTAYNDNTKKKENITVFLENFSFLSYTEKQKTINDVNSYINV